VQVVILHQHFNTPTSGGAIRSYYLAKALYDSGKKVTVITAHKGRYTCVDAAGVTVHYLPVPYDNRFGFSARSWSFLVFVFGIIRRPRLFKKTNIIYAISVPLTIGLAALWIKRFYKIPFFFEVGDLWPDAPIQLGFIKSTFFKKSLLWFEKLVYRKATKIVALSAPIKQTIEKKQVGVSVAVIPNMADTEYYFPSEKNHNLIHEYKLDGKFVVSYIGSLGIANGLEYFISCAHASQQQGLNVHFLLCGDGAMVDDLKELSQELELTNISMLGFKDRSGVGEVMNVTDASFISYQDFPILETGSPNKYFDGLAAGKLIVVNFGGWIKKEIEDNDCGFYVDPNDPSEFPKKIKPFLTDKSMLEKYSDASRKLAEQKYSRAELSKKFVALFSHAKGAEWIFD